MTTTANDIILTVHDLKKHFVVRGKRLRKHVVRAVDGVSFSIARGQTLALVGESGSGKTTVGRTLLHLTPPTAGTAVFAGQDISRLHGEPLRVLRQRMQLIFQDPYSSLDPRMTVGDIVAEPLVVHKLCPSAQARRDRVAELLWRVGLEPVYASRYPHEFSGGQRQRIGIARALASNPECIVCDEPVSALDVSIQAQILNLLSDLQDQLGLTYLFIAHNLAVVEHFAHRVAVMYLGKIVEIADRDELYANARHPYTETLFSAVPRPDPTHKADRIRLEGETPSPIDPPTGCSFHPRCWLSRQLAAQAPGDQVAPIRLPDQSEAAVMRACVENCPGLLPLAGKLDHCHACHFRR